MTILSIQFTWGMIDIDNHCFIDSSGLFLLRNYVCLHLKCNFHFERIKTRKTLAEIAISLYNFQSNLKLCPSIIVAEHILVNKIQN